MIFYFKNRKLNIWSSDNANTLKGTDGMNCLHDFFYL